MLPEVLDRETNAAPDIDKHLALLPLPRLGGHAAVHGLSRGPGEQFLKIPPQSEDERNRGRDRRNA